MSKRYCDTRSNLLPRFYCGYRQQQETKCEPVVNDGLGKFEPCKWQKTENHEQRDSCQRDDVCCIHPPGAGLSPKKWNTATGLICRGGWPNSAITRIPACLTASHACANRRSHHRDFSFRRSTAPL